MPGHIPAKRQPLAVLPHAHTDRPPPDPCPARNAGPSAAANLTLRWAVLEHLPRRGEIIAWLLTALRPGGVLMLEDLVFGAALLPVLGRIVSPSAMTDAFTRVVPAMAAGFRAAGADPEFGLELPAALAAAGLREVDAELTCRLIRGGSAESTFYAMALQDLGPRLIAAGLLSERDLAEPLAVVQDPASRWFSLGMVTAWGLRG